MNYFNGIIGQDEAKGTLGMYLDGHNNGMLMPHLILTASKGAGKTMIARRIQKNLLRDEALEVNGSQLTSPKRVIEGLFSEIQSADSISVFIDEVHGMSKNVQNLFLPILNTEEKGVTQIMADGVTYEFDFNSKVTFLFATTEKQNIFGPLLDRMTEVSLSDYKPSELSMIVAKNVKQAKIRDEALAELAKYSRGNPRWAAKTGQNINLFCGSKGIREFGVAEVEDFNKIMGIYAYGLNRQEVTMLNILAEYQQRGASLKVLAARTGNTGPAQMDLEKYPQKHGLMEIDGVRRITQKGIDVLKGIEVN